jgi:peptidyl-prolyl cis-trans isomerase C
VTVSDAEVKQEISEMRSGYTDDHFNEAMVDGLMTHETLSRRVRERLTIDRYFQEVVFKDLDADDRAVEEFVKTHRQELDRPEKVRVQHIVVKTEEEIAHIRERLRAGEEFAGLAQRYSAGPEAKTGGEIPTYAKGALPQVFDAAFRVPVGQVSEPQPSPYGYHLFKILQKLPAAQATSSDAASDARLKILEQKKRAAQERWLATARAGAVVALNSGVLESIP